MEKKTPTLCLNMIVKNEAKIIERSFNSVIDYIDYWVICDTGSTDGTQDIITNYFKKHNIDGQLHQHEWKNFGHNRSLALQAARGSADYILLMDADMELIVEDKKFKDNLVLDLYNILQTCHLNYYNIRIVRGNLDLEYIGVTHEVITSKNYVAGKVVAGKVDGIKFIEHYDGGTRSEKYTRDLKLLTEGLETETNPILRSRYMFYLAQTYHDITQFEKSIEWYQKRTESGGWNEEVHISYYMIGMCKSKLKLPQNEIIEAFLKCYNYKNNRVEPLYQIIHMLRISEKYEEAFKYVDIALRIEYPINDTLYIFSDIYDYKLKDEVALCAYNTCRYSIAHSLWNQILTEKKYHISDENRITTNFNITSKMMTTRDNKKTLCFYIGYTADLNQSTKIYGSELATIKLAEQLAKYFNVYIFGANTVVEIQKNNVIYFNSSKLNNFLKHNDVEIMIISRFIHYFVEFAHKAKKTYLWLHDAYVHYFWNGHQFPQNGKYILESLMPRIDGIITLCDWHKKFLLEIYDIDPKKIFILGNAIDVNLFNENITKEKNRFIYTSMANRGLDKLIEYFHEIKKELIDAHLYIYRGKEDFTDQMIEEMAKYDYIHYMGAVDNTALIKEFQKSDFWFYPTNWLETYCISALEAQLAGCVCITSNIGALTTTVGNRGILLKNNLFTEEYKQEALNAVINIANNNEIKTPLQENGKEWAKLQTWENRANEWINVFNLTQSDV